MRVVVSRLVCWPSRRRSGVRSPSTRAHPRGRLRRPSILRHSNTSIDRAQPTDPEQPAKPQRRSDHAQSISKKKKTSVDCPHHFGRHHGHVFRIEWYMTTKAVVCAKIEVRPSSGFLESNPGKYDGRFPRHSKNARPSERQQKGRQVRCRRVRDAEQNAACSTL